MSDIVGPHHREDSSYSPQIPKGYVLEDGLILRDVDAAELAGSRPTAPEPDDLSVSVDATGLGCAPHPALGGSRTAPEPRDRHRAEYDEAMQGWIVRTPDGVFVCSTRTETWEGGDQHIGRADAEKIAALLSAGPPPAGDPSDTELLEVADQLVYEIEDEARRWPSSMAEFRHFALPKLATLQRKLGELRAALRGESHQPETWRDRPIWTCGCEYVNPEDAGKCMHCGALRGSSPQEPGKPG